MVNGMHSERASTAQSAQYGSAKHVPEASLRRAAHVHAETVAGEHRPMRRADREILAPSQIADVLRDCSVVRIAYADVQGLTIVPINFAYDYDLAQFEDPEREVTPAEFGELALYMHSAHEGRKLDAIAAAGNALQVAFEMDCDEHIYMGRTPCTASSGFRSIVGTGVASVVDDVDEKRRIMSLLMMQRMNMPNVEFTPAQMKAVTVWKVVSKDFAGKWHPVPHGM